MKHVESSRSVVRRRGALLTKAAVAGGVVAVGAAFGVLLGLSAPGTARAGETNYVRSSSHEAISQVRLDEEVTILFNAPLAPESVGPDTILVRTGPTLGEQARGSYVIGAFMYDRNAQRRVVVRPEAIQEYYQLVKGFSREDATRLAAKTIQQIERRGKPALLAKIDRALLTYFGAAYGSGTRLDDDDVFAVYPAVLDPSNPIRRYRELIAGDDPKWQFYQNEYFNPSGVAADAEQAARFFKDLRDNPEYERFHHAIDPATGVAEGQSVLRGRKYRRVLFNRLRSNRVTFVPEIPIRADLTDTGYRTAAPYTVVVPTAQPGVFNTVLTRRGHRPLLQQGGRDYSTYFTTLPGTVSSGNLFLDNESRTGLATLQKPRIINVTPPNGETFVDRTTDWEDPDNNYDVPEAARRAFTIRLRFAQPLDPRTVSPTNFTLRQVKINPGTPQETPVSNLVPVGTFLTQNRLGIVEVEMTPVDNPDPDSEYEVVVKGLVKSLGGVLLNTDYKVSFITGQADPPLDGIREDFRNDKNKANPADPLTADSLTTCWWPAPAYLDPTGSGRAVARFMPFAGSGVGARQDPIDPNSPIVTDLVVSGGAQITFLTENVDPLSADFGKQVEYNYRSVQILEGTAVRAVGRFPLILRSQTDILVKTANVLVNGSAGGRGTMNVDTVGGPPTGGLGGLPGPGGYRGGDGGAAPLTDPNGNVILDGQGRLQFAQAKVNGSDGAPGWRDPVSGILHGGGAGGFSGDREAAITFDWDGVGGIGSDGDKPLEPGRFREAGGGGGHSTPGEDGAGARGSRQNHSHPAGDYPGGVGGNTYGDPLFADAPLNAAGVPTLTLGHGGAGGGGGGMEDDAPLDVVGPEDAGGGGGGGGGGAIQLTARRSITLNGATIDASGGAGGATRNAQDTSEGQGAPGGCGAGGSIWLQAFEGDIEVTGSTLNAGSADNAGSRGEITTGTADTDTTPSPIKGNGGKGGLGYIALEDVDGVFLNLTTSNVVTGTVTTGVFYPEADGSYPGRGPEAPMILNVSQGYSRWFNSLLETPTYVAQYDDPLTPTIEGTKFDAFDLPPPAGSSGQILLEARTAPNDVNNTGNPNLLQATGWRPFDQLDQISDRRFIQFRMTFTLPLNFDLDATKLPYVDFVQINIVLR